MKRNLAIFLVVTGLTLTGCQTPMGVDRVGMDRAFEQITASALTSPELSAQTLVVLGRFDLRELAEKHPDQAVAKLQERACEDKRLDALFALADLSYSAAEQYEKFTWVNIHQRDGSPITLPGKRAARAYYFASAVYSYFYLFGESSVPPSPFNREYRLVCDFYNRGLAKSLRKEGGDTVDLQARDVRLPMGQVSQKSTRPGFEWSEAQFHQFIAMDEYAVRGLKPRERVSGLGMPLVAIPDRAAFGSNWPAYFAPEMKVPATAFLRIEGTICDMTTDRLKATVELYSNYENRKIEVNGKTVPLEADTTAALAYGLQHSVQWKVRIAQFLSGRELIKGGIYLTQPYTAGKIPVIFVYGTSGSPSDWAGAFNRLRANEQINTKYQFWYFIYNTGSPVAYSGWRLRASIDQVVKELDPTGQDPALRNIVVIGHSQGGLVTKLSAVDSDQKFWSSVSDTPIDQLKISDESKLLLQNSLNFQHSPYVKRVVLACAPNEGSILVNNLIQSLSLWLIRMPGQLTSLSRDIATLNFGQDNPAMKRMKGKVPTSVANMNPGNPFLVWLHGQPLADSIKGHTIIGKLGDLPFEQDSDGVVACTSARLPGMESEDIVRGGHGDVLYSPVTVEKLQRILQTHLKESGK